jgi:DNA replication protein DnaC
LSARSGRTPAATAKLRVTQACVEDIDFAASRRRRRLFQQLATGQWLKSYQNLIITGACGTGKTWWARPLGHNAARVEFTVPYQRLPRRFADLVLAPRRRPLPAPVPQPVPDPSVDPRRLGAGTRDRRAAPGST